MKVVHITTIDTGGAYKAALRLHEGIRKNGVDSCILVRTQLHPDSPVSPVFTSVIGEYSSKTKNVLNMLKKDGEITGDFLGTDLSGHRTVLKADIIVLHWINSFLTPRELSRLFALHKPIVWIMHDMWLFTGGCHTDGYCGRYETGCGNCPQVKHRGRNDLSRRNFRIKERLLREMEGVIIGPSRWIVDCASRSDIVRGKTLRHIPNTLNTSIFCYLGKKNELKHKYHFAVNKKVLLFGAADAGTGNANKGFRYVEEAMKSLKETEYQLAVFGNTGNMTKHLEQNGVRLLGYIEDERKLVEIYNAADLFVTPSLQESFGYTACEAMACGTPVVAFHIGGLGDQIIHGETGYLAEPENTEDFIAGILYCSQNLQHMQRKLSDVSQRYSYEMVVPQYMELFRQLLNDKD